MSKRNKRITLFIGLLVLLCLAVYIYISYINPQPVQTSAGGAELNVTIIDVGQGDSILITLGSETMLIDAAEQHESGAILNELQQYGITDIDILVATHPHADHIGGMADIIDNYHVGKIYMADTGSQSDTYDELIETINRNDIPIIEAYAGVEFPLGPAACTIVSPSKQAHDDANNESVAIFLDYNNSEFLFAGDMEQEAEEEMISSGYYIDADVLKVAHHGSSTGTSEAFLEAVTPEYAAISCGSGNSYGHPHKETTDLLDEFGAKTYRTDISGDITFISDGQNIEVVLENKPS